MSLLNHWTGNNTTNDIINSAHLSWDGTPEYQDNAFKLISLNGQSTNKLIFPDFPILPGIPFSYEGELFAENNNGFPHLNITQNSTKALWLLFDFSEGFFQVCNAISGWTQWFTGLSDASINTWWPFKLTYDGTFIWKFYMGGEEIPECDNSQTGKSAYKPIMVPDSRIFGGVDTSPHMEISNWPDWGNGYILLKNLKFYDDNNPPI